MRQHNVTVWRDGDGDWRWTRRASNGKRVAVSGEGYRRRAHAIRMAFEVNELIERVRCESADGSVAMVSRPDGST